MSLYAQFNADFTASDTTGCNTLNQVVFTATYTGTPTNFIWMFGNGNTSNGIPNPEATYGTPGTYDVTLIITNGAQSETIVKPGYIVVFKNPVANFTATTPRAGCQPLSVTFDDLSTPGDAGIAQWEWVFGDGAINDSANGTTHVYLTASSQPYPVSLEVTDSNGCKSVLNAPSYITVTPKPVTAWTGIPNTACEVPHTVNFQNSSTGTAPLNYFWSFGDGNTSTSASPSYTYTNFGEYDVKLVVTDNNGCSDSLLRPDHVRLANVVAGFTETDSTVCPGTSVIFSNTSTGATTYQWFIDNVQFSTSQTPSIPFNIPGDYTIQLISKSTGTCADTTTQLIHVYDPVVADFGTSGNYICELPDTIQYFDSSVNAATYAWIFGNGQTSSSSNPSIIYDSSLTYQGNLVADSKFGIYTDRLIVTSLDGCRDTMTIVNNVEVNLPRVIIAADSMKGCIPLGVNFTDQTVSTDSIVSWEWDFGDGTTSTDQNPHHIYTVDGDVFATLTITNNKGCKATGLIKIEPGSKPIALFTIDRDTTCASNSIQFTDLSDDPAKVDEWNWTFGDQYNFGDVCDPSSGAGGSTIQNPVYVYQDTGFMDIELIVGYNQCYDTLKIEDTLYVRGPVANVIICFDCDSPYDITIDGSVTAASSWTWDLGDGTTFTSPTLNINHTYATSGDYTVTMVAVNDTSGCAYTESPVVTVRGIQVALNIPDTIACVGESVMMTGAPSIDEGQFSVNAETGKYYFDFGDGKFLMSEDSSVGHIYSAPGGYQVKLVVRADNGCSDTIVKNVYIYKPDAGFTTSGSRNGCLPFTSQLVDTSLSDTLISTYFWDFGNGLTSTLQNPTTSYSVIGNYTVQLIVKDTLGCSDTANTSSFFIVTNPEAKFTRSSDNTICVGDSVSFTNQSTGTNLGYAWFFGDNSTDTTKNPVHTYLTSGTFTVTLAIADPNGCKDTASNTTLSQLIYVQDYPNADFNVIDSIYTCFPTPLIQFTHTNTVPAGSTFSWDLGNGATSAIENPFYKYTQADTFTVSLIIKTPYGCADTVTKVDYIKVSGPQATYSVDDTICKNELVVFTITSMSGVGTYNWDFGDGTPLQTGDPISHQYKFAVGEVYPQLVLNDPNNQCTIYIRDTIFVHDVNADFSVSDSIGCSPHAVSFNDLSSNVVSYSWSFGDGGTASVPSPTHTYAQAGNFNAQLVGLSTEGCRDTLIKNINVFAPPVLNVTGNTNICEGTLTQLFASGGIKYLWTPPTGLSSDTIPNPVIDLEKTTTYTVQITDANNCTTTASQTVNVVEEPAFTLTPDTSIIIGDSMQLFTVDEPGLIYKWTPFDALSCDDCFNPYANPLVTTDYTVTVTDPTGCFTFNGVVKITVKEGYTIDVPNAFTPDGDGVNDIVYVDGWGLKELLDFKIYNRWGQVVFTSNNLAHGWDGTFKGVPQNIETYVYIAKGKTYQDKILEKQGYIQLIR